MNLDNLKHLSISNSLIILPYACLKYKEIQIINFLLILSKSCHLLSISLNILNYKASHLPQKLPLLGLSPTPHLCRKSKSKKKLLKSDLIRNKKTLK